MLQLNLLMIVVMRRAVWNHSCGPVRCTAHRVPLIELPYQGHGAPSFIQAVRHRRLQGQT